MENKFTVARLLLLLLGDGWNRSTIECKCGLMSAVLGVYVLLLVLWIKVSGQKIMDYVYSTVNNLKSI